MPPVKADWSSKWLTKTKPRRWKLPPRRQPKPLPQRKRLLPPKAGGPRATVRKVAVRVVRVAAVAVAAEIVAAVAVVTTVVVAVAATRTVVRS